MTQQKQFTKAVGNANEINELLRRYGVKFGIYKNGVFNEQFFPFDPIPRVISYEDFQSIEKGLVQRVNALNEFLFDIYHEKRIVHDGVVPEDFIYISKGYLAQCEGVTPKNKVYSHISGIDLVQAKDGEWYILEDNASYDMETGIVRIFKASDLTFCHPIGYVHELQNALRLCEVDKEITI